MKVELTFSLNGSEVCAYVEPSARLLRVIREALGDTSVKEGCGEGECGACTVLIDGHAVNACLYPALEARGKRVQTALGLLTKNNLSEIQAAFVEATGVQCGFCTPGMVMSSAALLAENPEPSDAAIRDALTGNLCRCTGYVQIVESIRLAAKKVKEAKRHA